SSSRLVTTRSAPARASARANVRPSPRLAPVTMATRRVRSNGVSDISLERPPTSPRSSRRYEGHEETLVTYEFHAEALRRGECGGIHGQGCSLEDVRRAALRAAGGLTRRFSAPLAPLRAIFFMILVLS